VAPGGATWRKPSRQFWHLISVVVSTDTVGKWLEVE
jgi:hypothetical protein